MGSEYMGLGIRYWPDSQQWIAEDAITQNEIEEKKKLGLLAIM